MTIPARRGAEHALPAAAVVVLERYHPRCSRLRAINATVAQSDLAATILLFACGALGGGRAGAPPHGAGGQRMPRLLCPVYVL